MSFKEMLEDAAKLPETAAKLNDFWMLELQEAERRYLADERKPGDVVCSWLDARDSTKHFGRFQPERLKKFRGGDCVERCRAPVDCTVCHLRKKPIGRRPPSSLIGLLCDWDCPGYYQEPRPPHLWPNEDLSPQVDEVEVAKSVEKDQQQED